LFADGLNQAIDSNDGVCIENGIVKVSAEEKPNVANDQLARRRFGSRILAHNL
jgi:hypothetical protein